MVDVLIPVSELLNELAQKGFDNESFNKVLEVAQKASEAAAKLKATKGRARYLDGKEVGLKDPGCELVVSWLSLISKSKF